VARKSGRFQFDGGAGTYLGTGILAALITIITAGICYPFAMVLLERWRCKHSYIDGQRLVFTGTGIGLFGLWIKWFLLIIITTVVTGVMSWSILGRIRRILKDNVQPATVNVRETTQNLKGTVSYISDTAVKPVFTVYGIAAGARRFVRVVSRFGGQKKDGAS